MAGWSGNLVVDLSECYSISSRGFGLLVALRMEIARKGRRYVLRRLPPRIADQLALSRLTDILPVEEEA